MNLTKRAFKRTLRRAGCPAIRFHDLRHTYASLLIAAGANIKFIQSQLGHASITTTLNTYGHLLPKEFRGETDRLSRLVFEADLGHGVGTVPETQAATQGGRAGRTGLPEEALAACRRKDSPAAA